MRHSGAWLSKVASQERRIWNGLSFELVCLEHIGQIKRALGISGIQTEEHAWYRKSAAQGGKEAKERLKELGLE